MPTLVPIFKGRKVYVPTFDIKISGGDLPAGTARDIVSVRYTDSVEKIDGFDLTINNWDPAKFDFKYTGSKKGGYDSRSTIFDPGQTIELSMGYVNTDDPNAIKLMLVGVITSITPSFPSSGQPTLRVSGQNVLRKLLTKQRTAVFKNMKSSAIARKVVSDHPPKLDGFVLSLETGSDESKEPEVEHVRQTNQFDVLFLLQLAHRNGYDLVLKQEGEKQFLYFGPSSSSKDRPSYILKFGESLIDFQPTLSIAKQVKEVIVRAWDPDKKEAIIAKATRDQLNTQSLKDTSKLKRIEGGVKERQEIVTDRPFHNKQEAERYALAMLERSAKGMVSGKGSTIGTNDLRAGSLVEMEGLGTTFDGSYYIASTTHTIGAGGYVTEFEARVEEPS
jgi:uncharacterized protein